MENSQLDQLSELVYRLGAIEAKIEANKTNWVEPVRRINDMLGAIEKALDKDIISIKEKATTNRATIDKLETEIQSLKDEIQAAKIKVSTIMAGIGIVWLVFGDAVSRIVERII